MDPSRTRPQAVRQPAARRLRRTQANPHLRAARLSGRAARHRARRLRGPARFLPEQSACARCRIPAVRRVPSQGACKMEKELIGYQAGECALGALLVAMSQDGVCAILLGDDASPLVSDLHRRFPRARCMPVPVDPFEAVSRLIASPASPPPDLPLDLRGSEFERRVWLALREIPAGTLRTYGESAERVGAPRAAKEVGEACASNSLAVAVPCHRVVRKDGSLAGYRWGAKRKLALLRLEGARLGPTPDLFDEAQSGARH